jgi:hypothetical protein
MECPPDLQVLASLDRIVSSSATLTQRWRADWGDDPQEERLAYAECGTIADYLIELSATEPPPADLAVVSQAIDDEYQTVNAEVLNWLQVGVLECIQHRASSRHRRGSQPVTAGEVKTHLGPLAQRSWEKLDDVWGASVDDI